MSLRDRVRAGHHDIDSGVGLSRAIDDDMAAHLRRLLLAEVNLSELSALTDEAKRARLERVVGALLTREGPLLSNRERSRLVRRTVDEALGLGILEPLLEDDTVTEIMVNGAENIFVERAGRLHLLPIRFSSEAQVYQAIDRIVASVNRRVDESSPMVDARLSTGERVNVIVPPLAVDGPTITIRRFPTPYSIEQLIGLDTFDQETADLLGALVLARTNILISGGTGSGKTTMLNALSSFIPERERIVTIEDAAELALQQLHVIRLEARPANVEGEGQVTIRDLVRNSLRMRPDRIIVGETRGGEALDMLQAMNTGHEGSLATIHANGVLDALLRMETLCTMGEIELPHATLRDQVNTAIDVIVQLTRLPDGRRRIVEIAALTSQHREDYQRHSMMRFEADDWDGHSAVTGRVIRQPLTDELLLRCRSAGAAVPPAYDPRVLGTST
ncbi:CpaF family protein [Nocardioides conyzicola]|uniref:CpaF family protein n=1 Tax=Nocardioides conyzicola TaxID=1651781 RepID=A0ABP8XDH7_9ACTN